MSLEAMLAAAVNRDGKSGSDSTIVSVDIQQKIEFSVRGGSLEFMPAQDDEQNTRRKFIGKVFKDNRLSQRLNYAMALYLTKGEILWLVLPDDDSGYLIEFFHGGATDSDPEYKVFYKPGGRKLDRVIITYAYKTAAPIGGFEVERWVKLTLTEDWIEQSDLPNKPSLSGINPIFGHDGTPTNIQKYPNPFAPTLPVILSPNNPKRIGQPGTSDYHWLKSQIESHEQMVGHIKRNLRFFGNPTLVTTRSPQEVTEAVDRGLHQPTWSSQQGYTDGFGDSYSQSSRVADPLTRYAPGMNGQQSERMAQVIGGVSEGERFGYISPDPVTGDLNQFQKQERELIHYALGGIDPLGMSSGATAFEVKTLFGRVENTADGKADGLYTHGLALVFEQILYFEEKLFKDSLFLGMIEAEPKRWPKLEDPSQISDEIAQVIYQTYKEGKLKLSQEPQGMMPLGDRTINWRYTRPVFKNSTREMLDLSIASRNAREDGLSQEYCLRLQHPDMTDKEIQNAMSGFSPRVVEGASNSLTILIQLYQQFMQLPDPQDPSIPWGVRLGVSEMLEQGLLTLNKELAYGKLTYDPAESSPAINAAASQLRIPGRSGSLSEPTTVPATVTNSNAPTPTPNYPAYSPAASMVAYGLPAAIPTATNPAASAVGSYRQDSGLSQGTGQPTIPAPGATISSERRSVLRNGYSADGSSTIPGIPPGVSAEFISNPYLWSLYAPQSGYGNSDGSGSGFSSSGSKRRSKRSN